MGVPWGVGVGREWNVLLWTAAQHVFAGDVDLSVRHSGIFSARSLVPVGAPGAMGTLLPRSGFRPSSWQFSRFQEKELLQNHALANRRNVGIWNVALDTEYRVPIGAVALCTCGLLRSRHSYGSGSGETNPRACDPPSGEGHQCGAQRPRPSERCEPTRRAARPTSQETRPWHHASQAFQHLPYCRVPHRTLPSGALRCRRVPLPSGWVSRPM